MKIFVMHDDHGKIGATFAAKKDNIGVNAMAGMKLYVFDHENLDDAALKKYLHELHTTFRVDSGPSGSRLLKLKESQPKTGR